jgi:arginase
MNVDLIYATWPNQPQGNGWYREAELLRDAGLTKTLGDSGLKVSEHVLEARGEGAGELKAAFELGAEIGALVRASHKAGSLAVIVCGSCSVAALGAISGLGGEHTGVLWMDAHADINTPDTTKTGLFEGMPVAMMLGEAWQGLAYDVAGVTPVAWSSICYYGVRDLDPPEQEMIEEEGLPIVEDAESAISELDGCDQAYIHLDMDVHDPEKLRANQYAGPGGPSPQTVRKDLARLARELPVAVFALTGIDPAIAEDDAVACAIAHIKAVCDSRTGAKAA